MTDLRKPTKRIARGCRVPHRVKPDLVITLYPGGTVGIRELGRRKEVQLDAGVLYVQGLLAEARESKKARQRQRRGR